MSAGKTWLFISEQPLLRSASGGRRQGQDLSALDADTVGCILQLTREVLNSLRAELSDGGEWHLQTVQFSKPFLLESMLRSFKCRLR